jgi:hypothetical protein
MKTTKLEDLRNHPDRPKDTDTQHIELRYEHSDTVIEALLIYADRAERGLIAFGSDQPKEEEMKALVARRLPGLFWALAEILAENNN